MRLRTDFLNKSLQGRLNFYNHYHKENKNHGTTRIIGRYNFTYYPVIAFISPYLKDHPVKRILDCGCGVGSLSLYFGVKGYEVVGIDLSSDAISLANFTKERNNLKNVSFFRVDVEHLQAIRKFDLIICSEVIEHINNDHALIQTLSRLLNKNGLLLITTPSKSSLLFKLGLLKNFDKRVGHLRRYEMDGLKKILEESGQEIIGAEKKESIIRNLFFTFPQMAFLIKFIRGRCIVYLFHQFDNLLVHIFGESNLYILSRKRS